jgi:hypothetical protein
MKVLLVAICLFVCHTSGSFVGKLCSVGGWLCPDCTLRDDAVHKLQDLLDKNVVGQRMVKEQVYEKILVHDFSDKAQQPTVFHFAGVQYICTSSVML